MSLPDFRKAGFEQFPGVVVVNNPCCCWFSQRFHNSLQLHVEDRFRGRVFAAEAALTTLTMAASNYVVAELMDGFGFSPRVVTAGVGIFFLMPGLIWFVTRKWWDQKERVPATASTHEERSSVLETEHIEI